MNKFTNKQEYLEYRKQWKHDYKLLSEKIRDFKYMKKIHQQVTSPIWSKFRADSTYTYPIALKTIDDDLLTHEQYQSLFKKHSLKHNYGVFVIDRLKKQATDMLLELKEAKIEAQRQYLTSKQLSVCL
jgi:hypothetical protein